MALIYMITCRINGKRYIGMTTHSAAKRWGQHVRSALRDGHDYALHRAIRAYGADAFYCPVYERTGAQNCDHRRWHNCWAAYKNWQAKPDSVECRNSFRTAAQEMHDFLVSLRPQQET